MTFLDLIIFLAESSNFLLLCTDKKNTCYYGTKLSVYFR